MGRGKKWTSRAREDLAKAFISTCKSRGAPDGDSLDLPFWEDTANEFYAYDATDAHEYRSRTPKILQHTHKTQYGECKQFSKSAIRKVLEACPAQTPDDEVLSMAVAMQTGMSDDVAYQFRHLEHSTWVCAAAWKVYSNATFTDLAGLEELGKTVAAKRVRGGSMVVAGEESSEGGSGAAGASREDGANGVESHGRNDANDNGGIGGQAADGDDVKPVVRPPSGMRRSSALPKDRGPPKKKHRGNVSQEFGCMESPTTSAALLRIARALEASVALKETRLAMLAFDDEGIELDEEEKAQKLEFKKLMRRKALDIARGVPRVEVPAVSSTADPENPPKAPVLEIKIVR